MTRQDNFRYPRSGVLLTRLLSAMGYGPKSWPGKNISATTFKRIATDELTTFSRRDFIDEALGLLGSPSGRWSLGPASVSRSEVFDGLCSVLETYDRAVSQLNSRPSVLQGDRRHALPILTLLALRLGVLVGVAAAIGGVDLEEVWSRAPFVPGAFGRAVTRYAEAALPDTPWRERGEQSPIGKNTLDRWRGLAPGATIQHSSLKKFATWVAAKTKRDAAGVEWRLRWLAAGERVLAWLDRALGEDDRGVRWIERLLLTARHHAEVNHDLCATQTGLARRLLDREEHGSFSDAERQKFGRLLAWLAGRTLRIDLEVGPSLSEDEIEALRVRLCEDEPALRAFWQRAGVLHALGMTMPGYADALLSVGVQLEPYQVQHGEPAMYLGAQHDLIAHVLSSDDRTFGDDNIAAALHLAFDLAHAGPFLAHRVQCVMELAKTPGALEELMAVGSWFQALQRKHSGLAFLGTQAPVDPPPSADPALADFMRAVELRTRLSDISRTGGDEAVRRALEETLAEHPNLVEARRWLRRLDIEALLKMKLKSIEHVATVKAWLSVRGELGRETLREILALRRSTRAVYDQSDELITRGVQEIAGLCGETDDPWEVELDRLICLGRNAMILVFTHRAYPRLRLSARHTIDALLCGAHAAIQRSMDGLRAHHEARPEHPAPCLWLARFHGTLGDRGEMRRWARLANHLGEPAGLALLDSSV